MIFANHEKRIETYKETLLNHFIAQSDEEKEKTSESYKKIFQKLKENYDNIKNYYETQKLIFNTEQQLNSSSSLIPTTRDPAHPTGYMPKPHPEWDPKNLPEDDQHWDGISSIADIFIGRPIYSYPTWLENLHCIPSFASLLGLAAD